MATIGNYAGFAAKGPKQREGWRRLSVLLRDRKSRESLDAGKHERTAIARPGEAQPVFGLHASFEAARHAPLMGSPKAYDGAPTIRLAHLRPANKK
jgi:hypothetical protein